jgi:hypothetical protein
MGRSKTPPQLSAAFSGHSCNAKEFRTTICPNVGCRISAASVLLIEGKVVRRLLGWRTMIQQNLGNAQPGDGLRGMRERATLIQGKLAVWSEVDEGTEVELRVPASAAYTTDRKHSWLLRKLAPKA